MMDFNLNYINEVFTMFKFLKFWKKAAFWALVAFAVVLLITTLIGALFFDLTATTVFSWFSTMLVIVFGIGFIGALLCFLSWYFFTKPWVIVPIVAGLVLILATVILLIKPDFLPALDLGETLSPYLEFLKK